MNHLCKLLCLLFLTGCGTVTTTIEQPGQETITVVSSKNSVVTKDGDKLIVDNTGGDSDFKWFLIHLMSNTDIQVGDENNDND